MPPETTPSDRTRSTDRSLRLATDIEADNIAAPSRNGVREVTLSVPDDAPKGTRIGVKG